MTKKILGIKDWSGIVKGLFPVLGKVWLRVAAINLLTIATILIGTVFLAGFSFLFFGEVIENFFVSIQHGSYFPVENYLIEITILLVMFLSWLVLVTVFSVNGKVSNWLIIRDHTKKKKNPFRIYFVDAWEYLLKYILLGVKAYWPIIFIPIILFASSVIGTGIIDANVADKTILGIIDIVFITLLVVLIIYLIYRFLRMAFMMPALICFEKDTKETFLNGKKIVDGTWWKVFWSIICFGLLTGGASLIFVLPQEFLSSGAGQVSEELTINVILVLILSILDFSLSFFVLAPLGIIFIYSLMIYLKKAKKVRI